MTFCTAINCMDGRTHLSVISFLTKRFGCDHVDLVTEPGPNRIIAENQNSAAVESILQRVSISVDQHQSKGIGIVGHADCAGNPAGKDEQREQTVAAVRFIRNRYPSTPVIGLWLDSNWTVSEIEID